MRYSSELFFKACAEAAFEHAPKLRDALMEYYPYNSEFRTWAYIFTEYVNSKKDCQFSNRAQGLLEMESWIRALETEFGNPLEETPHDRAALKVINAYWNFTDAIQAAYQRLDP